jgi:hypothetical protein
MGLAEKSLIISTAAGWDWNIEQNQHQKISYKEARLVQAQFSRNPRYSFESKCNVFNYLTHNEHHCLIYRDEGGWQDFFTSIIKLNLAGVVISDFKELAKTGPEILAGSFLVIQGDNFN